MKKLLLILLGILIVAGMLSGCRDNDDGTLNNCPLSKINKADATVTGTIKLFHNPDAQINSRWLQVTASTGGWWPDSLSQVLLWSQEISEMPIGQNVTLHVSEWSKTHELLSGRDDLFRIRFDRIISSAMPERKAFSCAVFDEHPFMPAPASRTSLSDMEKITVNLYIHFLLEKDGSGLAASAFPGKAQEVLNTLTAHFNSTKISFQIKDYDGLPIDYSNFSFNNPSNLKDIFSRNSHFDGIDLYLTLKSTDISTDGETMGATIPSSYPRAAVAILDSGVAIAHELGHLFGLYHTHRGTCRSGGDSDDRNGTPEFVDGSNSAIAGDLIIDTPADPNVWDTWGRYAGGDLTDAHGDRYSPDPKNLMSYSGDQERFSQKQAEWMHNHITSRLSAVIVRPTISGPAHFSGSATFTAGGTEPKTLYTVVKRFYLNPTEEDVEPQCKLEYFVGNSITVTGNGSEYFEITTSYGSQYNYGTTLKATSGPPSPVTGTLWWKSSGREGFTTNMSHGDPLYINSDAQSLTLDYIDRAAATLSALNYTIVTATNRVVRGASMQLSRADCARGFLKVRMSDACGQAADYFTIPVQVIGQFYAVDVSEGKLSFSSLIGKGDDGNHQASPSNPRPIGEIVIFDDAGGQIAVISVGGDTGAVIDTSLWPRGEYKAVVSDGKGYTQEILFAI